MEVTLEVIIAIIALVVGSSPTCLVLWNCYIRRRQRMEQATVPLSRLPTITLHRFPHYEQPSQLAPDTIWKTRTVIAFETETRRAPRDEHVSRQGWATGNYPSFHSGGHHV